MPTSFRNIEGLLAVLRYAITPYVDSYGRRKEDAPDFSAVSRLARTGA